MNNPYPGLRPFEEKDSALFFGRRNQTYDLLRRIDDHRFVAVVGLSGSGKSSLVRAGLIPALRQGSLIEGGERWRVATLRPGNSPLTQLANALDEALGLASERLRTLKSSSLGLIQTAKEGRSPDENLLIVVDQFEEIFRYQEEGHERRRVEAAEFVCLLLTALEEARGEYRIYIVLTMRTEYVGDCSQFRGLPEALNDSQYLVPRLTQDQRREAIEQSALAHRGIVDGFLLQQLMADAGDAPDQLPILQHLLMRMWEGAEKEVPVRLTMKDYDRAGGWENALDNHGRDLLTDRGPSQRAAVRRIFERVTELGTRDRDRRRPTRLSELCRVCADEASASEVKTIVERFSKPGADFLTSPDWHTAMDPLIDLTHESLIRQWGELKTWAREEAESGEWYQRVEDRIHTKGETNAYLIGAELESAWMARRKGRWNEAWASRYQKYKIPFDRVCDFLEESDEHSAQEIRRLKRSRQVVGVVAVVLAVLLAAVAYLWKKASDQQREARAREFSAYAMESLNEDPERSILLAIQAVELSLRDNKPVLPAAESALHQAVWGSRLRATLRAHTGPVNRAVYSTDGKQIATAGDDNTVRVWDVASGTETATLHHPDKVADVVFSPDGKHLAACYGAEVQLWNPGANQKMGTLGDDPNVIRRIAFSADGKRLAAVSVKETMHVWDVEDGPIPQSTGKNTGAFPTLLPGGGVWSPDAKRIARAQQNSADIVDVATRRRVVLAGHSASVTGVAFSPDGTRVATASLDKTAKLWDAATGQEIATLRGHTGGVESVEFSPDGSYLVTGSDDGTAKIWDALDGQEALTLRGHTDAVSGVSFCPDGNHMVTASADGSARLWEADGGQQLWMLPGSFSSGVLFSRNGKWIATVGSKMAEIRDAANGVVLRALGAGRDSEPVDSLAFCPDGARLATGGHEGTATVWDAAGAGVIARMRGHRGDVNSVAFSPDDKLLATAGSDGTARLWDANSGEQVKSLAHNGPVLSVAFSPDGRSLATGDQDGLARIWDVATGRPLLTLSGHSNAVASVVFEPMNGKILATGSRDGKVRLWDTGTGRAIVTLPGSPTDVESLAFRPDGKRLAVAGQGGAVQVYAVEIGDLLRLARQRLTRTQFTEEECVRYFEAGACPRVN